jgi:hypothetical protein
VEDLAKWLSQQLDEDERIAKEAGGHLGEWRLATPLDDAELGDASWLRPPSLKHVERHDPARALRDVDAKRKLLEQCRASLASEKAGGVDGAWSESFGDGLLEAVKLLALPYADRPGYREDWRPS